MPTKRWTVTRVKAELPLVCVQWGETIYPALVTGVSSVWVLVTLVTGDARDLRAQYQWDDLVRALNTGSPLYA